MASPTSRTSCSLSSYRSSSLTVWPRNTRSSGTLSVSTTAAFFSFASRSFSSRSRLRFSSLAKWYSAFSFKSPRAGGLADAVLDVDLVLEHLLPLGLQGRPSPRHSSSAWDNAPAPGVADAAGPPGRLPFYSRCRHPPADRGPPSRWHGRGRRRPRMIPVTDPATSGSAPPGQTKSVDAGTPAPTWMCRPARDDRRPSPGAGGAPPRRRGGRAWRSPLLGVALGGCALRRWAWAVTEPDRYVLDIDNAFRQGTRTLATGFVERYDDEAAEPTHEWVSGPGLRARPAGRGDPVGPVGAGTRHRAPALGADSR